MKIIEVKGLCKKYHHHTIFNNVNLTIEKGKCYMLIGNNGAGKSTFIKCILAITPYNGVITKNVTKIGYVPEKMFLPQHLSVTDFLKQVAYVKGIKNGVSLIRKTLL